MEIRQWLNEVLKNTNISGKKLFIGVSGGSDSMGLLNALLRLQKEIPIQIAVGHINHHLREESDDEEKFVSEYCNERHIPIFIGHWKPTKTHIEENARQFRYDFFSKIMKEQHYDILCTAHHRDDRIETALRRIIAGYHLWDIDGLVPWQHRQGYMLWRPFLSWSKSDILNWCSDEKIPFVEDASNQSLHYERNRIRHQWIPMFQQENPEFNQNFIRFLDQLSDENQMVQQIADQELINRFDGKSEQWDIREWNISLTWALCRFLMKNYSIAMTQQKAVELDAFLQKIDGTKRWQLNATYCLEKVYDKIRVLCVETVEKQEQDVYTLIVNKGLFLSEDEWICLYDHQPLQCLDNKQWANICWRVPSHVPLQVRHAKSHDRFVFNRQGQTKKVQRFFIDQKIPRYARDKCWVLVDESQRIYGILPWRQSYLSNGSETDKINYIIYYYRIN